MEQSDEEVLAALEGAGEAAAGHFLPETRSFFSALSSEPRLKLVGILAARYRFASEHRWPTLDELAELSGLTRAATTYHLRVLIAEGIVLARTDTPRYRLDYEKLTKRAQQALSIERLSWLTQDVGTADARHVDEGEGPEWEARALAVLLSGRRTDLFNRNELSELPRGPKRRALLLRWLAEHFEPGAAYTEQEVNDTLKRALPRVDAATLRRALVDGDEPPMIREAGVYRRAR